MSVHNISLTGRRDSNEDKHNIILNLKGNDNSSAPVNYYGIYDGHGGQFVSTFLSQNLPQCFTDKRVQYPLSEKYVKNVYKYLQSVLETDYNKKASQTGSTCLIVIHFKKENGEYLNILNSGDSRCVVCRNNIAIALTKDHKPDWFEEQARIANLGGKIEFDGYDWRIKDLSVSRAFGDLDAAPYVTCIPDIYKYKLSKSDKFLVLACDGLWDVMSSQEVVNFVLLKCYNAKTDERINVKSNIAQILAKFAINERKSTDNVSVMVVFFM